MAEKVLTKKTFVGHGPNGRLALPGEEVDVDEKGAVSVAGSTPVGSMSVEQLEAELNRRRRGETATLEPGFGGNVADPDEVNTGQQRLEMAQFRPGSGTRPQGIPPGTEEHNNTFVRPAPAGAPAAVEVVVGTGAPQGVIVGNTGGSDSDDGGAKPLSKQNKAELLETAKARGVEVGEDDTKAEILAKLEKASEA